ncbi:MAG: TIGR03032 family protein [Gammaproteobacteria bacterium]|nr:TIGR03032 family protein [Gammaproteobacteria bacterium]
MNKALPPFTCTNTPEFPDILETLGCTLVLSTYQAGKVILLSTQNGRLIQLPRAFPKPMGIAVEGRRMAIATREETVVLADAPKLAPAYPKQPGIYDGLFVPRATYYTGELDIHDMAWGEKGLWAVNTRFSCLALIDEHYSFTPAWQPKFIDALTPDERCHLNGLALADGRPRYVTALGMSNTTEGWRENKLSGGILMDTDSQEIIVHGLAMPHSPRLYDKRLYLLNSARGELVHVDPGSGHLETVSRIPGFVRGMARCGDYVFIGVSKLRHKHQTFGDLPIAKESVFCGVVALHLSSGRLAGSVRYVNACEEIYDVQIIDKLRRPGILGTDTPACRKALVTPTACFWGHATEEK